MAKPNGIAVAEYLFTRLRQLGVRSIFGVPGDYNLSLLDYVEPSGLHWVGCCNELNAGYAADGYARINSAVTNSTFATTGVAALITTFGVGELSAINAIAGAYAELTPVVHIVGTPPRELQQSRARVHHTFCDGEHRRFAEIYSNVTIAKANLIDHRTIPGEIDYVLSQCLLHSRPVYIEVPADMVAVQVSALQIGTSLAISDPVDSSNDSTVLEKLLRRIYKSKRPAIYVDGESRAFNILQEVRQFITKTNWPTWTSNFGKGLIDESLPNVHGLYSAYFGPPEVKEYFESADLVICFGPHYSTTNTYQGTSNPKPEVSVEFSATMVKIGTECFRDLPAKYIINKLLSALDISKINLLHPYPPKSTSIDPAQTLPQVNDSDSLTQKDFYKIISPLVHSGDILLGETGTAGYGIREMTLPPHTRFLNPVTWLSIGYMLPAAFGAALVQRELISEGKWDGLNHARTILVIGDGSVQMTVQEISTIIRHKLDITIFIINNSGYTVERCLHGRLKAYNDVAPWRYLQMPSLFGANEPGTDYHAHIFQARTWGELKHVLNDSRMQKGRGFLLVEVFMDRLDAPATLLWYMNKQIDAEKQKDDEPGPWQPSRP